MPFKDNNVAAGLPKKGAFQVGVSDVDDDQRVVEQGIAIPWSSDPAGSYLYYDCTVGVMLDSGIVVHNRLPQVNRAPDTLSAGFLEDPDLDSLTGVGVNLRCQDQYQDIVQRMGHARYWFRLWGQAIRVGYKVPIPAIKSVGGVAVIPYDKNPQWAYNSIVPAGNYGGVILWRARWSLWYTVDRPPTGDAIPQADLAGHIAGDTTPPKGIQAPYTAPDDDAQAGPALVGGIKG